MSQLTNTNETASQHVILKFNDNIKELFSKKCYLEIINIIQKEKIFEQQVLDYFFFNEIVSCLIYAGISYLELDQFDDALDIFTLIEKRLKHLKNKLKFFKDNIKTPTSKQAFDNAEILLPIVEEQLNVFYKNNICRYLSNFAYSYYKKSEQNNFDKKTCKISVKYYKKALFWDSKNIQIILGRAQSRYYFYSKKLPKRLKNEYYITIGKLKNNISSFDVLLAIAKLYYFLEDYNNSLLYVQQALEFDKDPNNKIYAYDWLSRIAYKTKNYATAINFYEETINCIIKNPDYQKGEIHPRPKIYQLVGFLNDNKRILNKAELDLVNTTIWLGIFIASIFGFISNWKVLGCLWTFLIVLIIGIICKFTKT